MKRWYPFIRIASHSLVAMAVAASALRGTITVRPPLPAPDS